VNSEINVYASNFTASFLELSRYSIIGLPKTRKPVMAADRTSKISIAAGIMKLSGFSPKNFSPLDKSQAMAEVYTKTPRAFKIPCLINREAITGEDGLMSFVLSIDLIS